MPATLEPFGGRFLARGGKRESLEGDWWPQRVVLIEFPDFDAAKVARIAQAIRDGQFSIDAGKIADGLLAHNRGLLSGSPH